MQLIFDSIFFWQKSIFSLKKNVNKIYRSIHHYSLSHLSSQTVSFRRNFCVEAHMTRNVRNLAPALLRLLASPRTNTVHARFFLESTCSHITGIARP